MIQKFRGVIQLTGAPSESVPVRGLEVLSHSMRTSWRPGLQYSFHRHAIDLQRYGIGGFAATSSSLTASNTSIFESPFDDRCDLLSNDASQSKKNASPYIGLMRLCICMTHNLDYVA